jgi:transposase-like protein
MRDGASKQVPRGAPRNAPKLAIDGGRPIRVVARELGLNHETLCNWVDALRCERRDGPDASAVRNGLSWPACAAGSRSWRACESCGLFAREADRLTHEHVAARAEVAHPDPASRHAAKDVNRSGQFRALGLHPGVSLPAPGHTGLRQWRDPNGRSRPCRVSRSAPR